MTTTALYARAADIHASLGATWPAVLEQLGIGEAFLRPKKPGPCPACGGRDRYTFDNRQGRGDFFCRNCGAGDGFTLLQRVHGWDFREARERVIQAAGLASGDARSPPPLSQPRRREPALLAKPTARVLEILRCACEPADVADAREYLASRKLWPLPERCTLAAHATLEYFEERKRIGRFAALLAHVRDGAGELVTTHVTYLVGGRKLTEHAPRKLISPVTGRAGVAVRLLPIAGDTLGIAEGIETAIAAHRLHELPVWAAMNAALLAKFEPPHQVRTLVVFADRDAAGLEAAGKLMERLQGRVRLELRVPHALAKDWADVLLEHAA